MSVAHDSPLIRWLLGGSSRQTYTRQMNRTEELTQFFQSKSSAALSSQRHGLRFVPACECALARVSPGSGSRSLPLPLLNQSRTRDRLSTPLAGNKPCPDGGTDRQQRTWPPVWHRVSSSQACCRLHGHFNEPRLEGELVAWRCVASLAAAASAPVHASVARAAHAEPSATAAGAESSQSKASLAEAHACNGCGRAFSRVTGAGQRRRSFRKRVTLWNDGRYMQSA